MRLPWRRSRTLHEQLIEQAELEPFESAPGMQEEAGGWPEEPAGEWGFGASQSPPADVLGQPVGVAGATFHGMAPPPAAWDVVVTAEAPGLQGDELDFLGLEGGDVFMEGAIPRGNVSPLADAVEARLRPPYRAHAVRRQDELWAVSARRVRLERFQARGNDVDLTVRDGERTLRVDGSDAMADVPELETFGQEAGPAFHVRASRVDGDLWEVEVSSL
ncbi:MAG: hypothetical protein ACXVZ1_10580 [Gaiellaceae bacterium]